MSITDKVKLMFRCSDRTVDELAEKKNKSIQEIYNRFGLGQEKIKPLLEICEFCGYKVTLENKELGISIPLFLADVEEDEQYNHNMKYKRTYKERRAEEAEEDEE